MAGRAAAIPIFQNLCSKAPPSGHFTFTGCPTKVSLPATLPGYTAVKRAPRISYYPFSFPKPRLPKPLLTEFGIHCTVCVGDLCTGLT